MASPFKVFRKHQKAAIAVLALLAMVAFVVLPIILQGMGNRPVQNPQVITTSRYGEIREFGLSTLRRNRETLLMFIQDVAGAVAAAGRDPRPIQGLEMVFGPADEEGVVRSWLLARRAEELGLVVSDEPINLFLTQITTRQGLSDADVRRILARRRISTNQLFALLKHEMLGLQLRQLFEISQGSAPPAQRWDYYQRLRKMATIEALPIPVAGFVGDVEAPDDETLQAFFDEHKDRLDLPGSPEPGFLVPHKIAVEYLKAEYDKLNDLVSISDEEIAQYYEQFKDQNYRKAELPEFEEDATEEPDGTEEASSTVPADQPFELLPDAEDDSPGPELPGIDEKADENLGPQFTATEEDAGLESPADDEQVEAGESAAEEGAVAEAIGPGEDVQTESTIAPEVEYIPLEEVTEEIRTRLAQAEIEDVMKRLRDRMQRYHDDVIRYNARSPEEQQTIAAPAKLDLGKLGEENGLGALRTTKLISAIEAEQSDIGRSDVDGNVPFTTYAYDTLQELKPAISQDAEGNHYLFWKIEDVPQSTPDFEDPEIRQWVLDTWKTIEARELARAEGERLAEDVRAAGKSLEEFFAGKPDYHVAQSEPFSWVTYGAIPAWFSQVPPRISEVKARVEELQADEESQPDAVEMPGNDFMREVFRLEKDEIGVAMNQPKTTVYVVRVTDVNPLPETLWNLFLAEDYSTYLRVAGDEFREAQDAWIQQIESSVDLEWHRTALRNSRRR